MKPPSLKHRKPIVYISLVIYSLFTMLIIVESCFPSSISGIQSDVFASISAFFVNIVHGPKKINTIKPSGFGEVFDSSFLGQDDEGVSNIAIGTTTLLSIEIDYPEKKEKDDVFDKSWTITKLEGNSDDYNIVSSSHTASGGIFYVDLRIVANNLNNDLYKIELEVAKTIKYIHSFRIVELSEPLSYEMRLNKLSLKQGESLAIDTKLLDDKEDDAYLRRYFDFAKLNRSTSNMGVATIDEYGVIHALNEGLAAITYGKYTFDVTVTNEEINIPLNNELKLDIDEKSNLNPSLLDYDYVFEKDESPNNYSTLIYASFTDNNLEDQSVTWITSDPLKAKLAPYTYDDDGYPIYHDEDNKPCVRVCGYRKKGDATITCVANYDNNVRASVNLTTDEAIPESMKVNVSSNIEIIKGQQKVISASFNPKNVNNKNINVEISNPSMVEISSNNTASVILTAKKTGTCHIKIKSLANESLTYEFEMKIIEKQAVNDDNFNDFAGFIRKFAGHFSLFLVTSIFGFIFFNYYFDNKKYLTAIIPSLSIGLLTASISEIIQHFVPGRNGTFLDVGIDFIGYLLGTLLSVAIVALIRLIKKKKEIKKEGD